MSLQKLRSFITRLGQIPKGFMNLFAESKEAFKLSYSTSFPFIKSKKELTRRDYELLRLNGNALTRMSIFFVLQLPPIIGAIPVCNN